MYLHSLKVRCLWTRFTDPPPPNPALFFMIDIILWSGVHKISIQNIKLISIYQTNQFKRKGIIPQYYHSLILIRFEWSFICKNLSLLFPGMFDAKFSWNWHSGWNLLWHNCGNLMNYLHPRMILSSLVKFGLVLLERKESLPRWDSAKFSLSILCTLPGNSWLLSCRFAY